jgi:hypothetical protein
LMVLKMVSEVMRRLGGSTVVDFAGYDIA